MVNEPLSGHKSIKQAIRYHRRIKLSLTRMAIHRWFRLKCLYGMLKAQMVLAHPKDLVLPDKANAKANTRLGHEVMLFKVCKTSKLVSLRLIISLQLILGTISK